MVVTRKPPGPSAPPMASRSNSSTSTPRASSARAWKTRDRLPSGDLSGIDLTKPSSLNGPPGSKLNPSHHKSKSHKHHKSSKPPPSFFRILLTRLFTYTFTCFVAYTIWVCPSDDKLQNPICHSLSLYKAHILEPYVLPPIYDTLSHPTIKPYVVKAIETYDTVEPHVSSAISRTRPYIQKAKVIAWDGIAVPTYERHVHPNYLTHVHPHLQKVSDQVRPFADPVIETSRQFASDSYAGLSAIYLTIKPHAQKTYETIKPITVTTYRTCKPYAIQSYKVVKHVAVQTYDKSKPYIRLLFLRLKLRAGVYGVKLGQMKKQYVDKHVGKIWDKVVEIGSTTQVEAKTVQTSGGDGLHDETEGETIHPTISTPMASTLEPSITEDEIESTSSPSPEPTSEEIVPTTEVTQVTAFNVADEVSVPGSSPSPSVPSLASSVEPTEASSTDDEPATPLASAVDHTPVPSSESADSETLHSASSIAVQSAHPAAQADDLTLDDLEHDDILSGILSELQDEEPVKADTSEQVVESKVREETAEEREIRMAEKRKNVVGRNVKHQKEMDEFAEKKEREVREILGRIRNGCVRALKGKGKVVDTEDGQEGVDITDDDWDTMQRLNGEPIAQVVPSLATEGEKMLKSLESYLNKELKAVQTGSQDIDARKAKFDKVASKLSEKFSDSSDVVNNKVRQWFIAVRDIEIRECLAIVAEVKETANRLQGDLSMDYAWLPDVTYKDWQRYHDIMRVHNRFDETVRMIQNGTHAEPPTDPLVAALNELQVELNEIIAGFDVGIRSIRRKALDEVFAVPSEPEQSTEPEVSILPISPPLSKPSEKESLDPEDILVGKDKVQVEQAVKDAPPHEEL